jgi:hypothetical protein
MFLVGEIKGEIYTGKGGGGTDGCREKFSGLRKNSRVGEGGLKYPNAVRRI